MKRWFRWNVLRWVVLGIAILFVAFQFVPAKLLFSDSHLRAPPGEYEANLEGDYEVATELSLQVPEVFRSERLTIRDAGNGKMGVSDGRGNTLLLTEGADGWYFSEDFDPVGARILPGRARNWNEGRLRQSADGVVVDGYMLEKGLMLFIFPFKDASEWRVELKRAARHTKEAAVSLCELQSVGSSHRATEALRIRTQGENYERHETLEKGTESGSHRPFRVFRVFRG